MRCTCDGSTVVSHRGTASLLSLFICDMTGRFSQQHIAPGVKPSVPVGKGPNHRPKKISPTSFTRRKVQRFGQNSHHLEKTYSCVQCDKRFSSPSGLRHHMNIHSKKHECTECDRCFKNRSDLPRHMRSHSGEKPFECTVCNKRFTRSYSLDNHSRIHSGEKPYKCHMCDKAFSQSGHLDTHMRVHTGDKPYKCSLCNESFSQSSHLQTHKRLVHSNIRPYVCPCLLYTSPSPRD